MSHGLGIQTQEKCLDITLTGPEFWRQLMQSPGSSYSEPSSEGILSDTLALSPSSPAHTMICLTHRMLLPVIVSLWFCPGASCTQSPLNGIPEAIRSHCLSVMRKAQDAKSVVSHASTTILCGSHASSKLLSNHNPSIAAHAS